MAQVYDRVSIGKDPWQWQKTHGNGKGFRAMGSGQRVQGKSLWHSVNDMARGPQKSIHGKLSTAKWPWQGVADRVSVHGRKLRGEWKTGGWRMDTLN